MQEKFEKVKFKQGYPNCIKVNQHLDSKTAIELAIKKWKKYLKYSQIEEQLKERQYYTKPSARRRETLKRAKWEQYLLTKSEQ